jgi:hypothetical protein
MNEQKTPNQDDLDNGEYEFSRCVAPGESFTNRHGVKVFNQPPPFSTGNTYITTGPGPTRIVVKSGSAPVIDFVTPDTVIDILNGNINNFVIIRGNGGTVNVVGSGAFDANSTGPSSLTVNGPGGMHATITAPYSLQMVFP